MLQQPFCIMNVKIVPDRLRPIIEVCWCIQYNSDRFVHHTPNLRSCQFRFQFLVQPSWWRQFKSSSFCWLLPCSRTSNIDTSNLLEVSLISLQSKRHCKWRLAKIFSVMTLRRTCLLISNQVDRFCRSVGKRLLVTQPFMAESLFEYPFLSVSMLFNETRRQLRLVGFEAPNTAGCGSFSLFFTAKIWQTIFI